MTEKEIIAALKARRADILATIANELARIDGALASLGVEVTASPAKAAPAPKAVAAPAVKAAPAAATIQPKGKAGRPKGSVKTAPVAAAKPAAAPAPAPVAVAPAAPKKPVGRPAGRPAGAKNIVKAAPAAPAPKAAPTPAPAAPAPAPKAAPVVKTAPKPAAKQAAAAEGLKRGRKAASLEVPTVYTNELGWKQKALFVISNKPGASSEDVSAEILQKESHLKEKENTLRTTIANMVSDLKKSGHIKVLNKVGKKEFYTIA